MRDLTDAHDWPVSLGPLPPRDHGQFFLSFCLFFLGSCAQMTVSSSRFELAASVGLVNRVHTVIVVRVRKLSRGSISVQRGRRRALPFLSLTTMESGFSK